MEEARGPLRVLLVDDHPFLRRGLRDVLEEEPDLRVVGEAGDADAAMRLADALYPTGLDLVLMDLDLPGTDGIAATRLLTKRHPDLPVVVLTVSGLERDLLAALRAGAVGYLPKSLAPEALVRALRAFHAEGLLPLPGDLARRFLAELRAAPTPPSWAGHAAEAAEGRHPLTAREAEVLALVAEGLRDRDIAERLVLTESTVKKHVQNILRKLDARNRTQAVMLQRGARAAGAPTQGAPPTAP